MSEPNFKWEWNGKTIVAFDVDGTLISYEDKPRYDVIQFFQSFSRRGCSMIVWSGGGEDYAAHWRDKLGLIAVIAEKKQNKAVSICFDDEPVNLAQVNILV